MPICYGVQSFVMASRAPVFHACSVDLAWQTTIHSCQRCPRAAMTPSAATAAIATQSNVEGTTSRFCPAGIHMGKCLPVQELYTGPWGSVASLSSPGGKLVSKSPQKIFEQSPGPSDLSINLDPWVPPNLPLPTTVHSKASFSPSVPITIQSPLPDEATPSPNYATSTEAKILIPTNALEVKGPLSSEMTEKVVVEVGDQSKANELPVIRPLTPPEKEGINEVKPVDESAAPKTEHETKFLDGSSPTTTTTSSNVSVIMETPAVIPDPKEEASKSVDSPTQIVTKTTSRISPEPPIKDEPVESKENVPKADELEKQKPQAKDTTSNATVTTKSLRPSQQIPQFYTPIGRSQLSSKELDAAIDRLLKAILEGLHSAANAQDETNSTESLEKTSNEYLANPLTSDSTILFSRFNIVTKACGCPLYWKRAIFIAAGGENDETPIPINSILSLWHRVLETCSDAASKFLYLLTKGKSQFLLPNDFHLIIQDVVDTHPSLAFLQAAPDFHSRYVTTVVSRIFFCTNASWTGRITLGELRKSNFLEVLASLETEEDINMVTHYFSYEHFYVIYCKFWELDADHDLIINKADLARHNNYAISERMIDRIFSGAVTSGVSFKEGTMSYSEFVWFLLAEEDKRHPRSIEYWFRCMDLDGDGFLSLFELEHFYSEQSARMEEMGIEPPTLEDSLCQCLDMVRPALADKIRLSDLKKCKLCPLFFDTFFNLPKYLLHEQRDPFSNLRDIEEGLLEVSDWDRYASDAYEMLIASEGGGVGVGGDVDEDNEEEDDEDAVLSDTGGAALLHPDSTAMPTDTTAVADTSLSPPDKENPENTTPAVDKPAVQADKDNAEKTN